MMGLNGKQKISYDDLAIGISTQQKKIGISTQNVKCANITPIIKHFYHRKKTKTKRLLHLSPLFLAPPSCPIAL